MAPSPVLSQDQSNKCKVPFQSDEGDTIYYDAQSAVPGSFVVPNFIDPDTFEAGNYVQFSWIYLKGDLMKGPQPGHPFEMPFDNKKTNFTLDLTNEDGSKFLQQVMPAVNASVFREGSAPFGKRGLYSMGGWRLDDTCKYASVTAMGYIWTMPENLDRDITYRLRLTTVAPASEHVSGRFRITDPGAKVVPVSLSDVSSASGMPPYPDLGTVLSTAASQRDSITYGTVSGLIILFAILCIFFGVLRARRITLK